MGTGNLIYISMTKAKESHLMMSLEEKALPGRNCPTVDKYKDQILM